MATFGQGAAGTRIRLRDVSGVTIVTDPNITGGIVGFSSKGEFNKIINLSSTSDIDVLLGNGFNNPKFNQGLYAAREVLNNGGFGEFVRVYGEAVEEDDTAENYEFEQALKTDTFLVEYDFSTPTDTSFDISHFASTRYIQDGFVNVGEREIFTVQEVIANNTNISFSLDSVGEDLDSDLVTDRLPIFAIMNTDPTSSNRAGNRFDIESITGDGVQVLVTTFNVNGFQIGDEVIIAGTTAFNGPATISEIVSVTEFKYDNTTVSAETEGAVFINEDSVESGVDSLTVRTVASGKSSKNFDYLMFEKIDDGGVYNLPATETTEGKFVNFSLPDGSDVDLEFAENYVSAGKTPVPIIFSNFIATDVTLTVTNALPIPDKVATILVTNPEDYQPGDIVQFYIDTVNNSLTGVSEFVDYIVASVSGNVLSFNEINGKSLDITAATGTDTLTPMKMVNLTGTLSNFGEVMVAVDESGSLGAAPVRGVFNGIVDVDTGSNSITVDRASKFDVGDIVVFSDIHSIRNQNVLLPDMDGTGSSGAIPPGSFFVVKTLIQLDDGRGVLTFDNYDVTPPTPTATTPLELFGDSQLTNGYKVDLVSFDVTPSALEVSPTDGVKFQVGDKVLYEENAGATITGLIDNKTYTVLTVDYATDEVVLDYDDGGLSGSGAFTTHTLTNITANDEANFRILNLTQTKGGSVFIDTGMGGTQLSYVGVYGLRYAETEQGNTFFDDTDSTPQIKNANEVNPTEFDDVVFIDESEEGIIIDTTMGRIFEKLGLAENKYLDVNFDFRKESRFQLTTEGSLVAALFLSVEYFFNGEKFEFSGTIVPFATGEINLYIVDAAANVENGWKFVINESAALEAATADPRFNFSNSESQGLIEDTFSQVSFNGSDPAVLNDAIWEYEPENNNTTNILSSAWDLFLDVDNASSDMLVAAGTAVSNLFVKNFEQINFTVMDKMLDICEKRKDCFAIFDGLDEARIDNALEKMAGIGGSGNLSRWGALFDGRSIFFDSIYTKLNVEIVKSIEVAAIITSNRAGGLWWLPPAGYQTGRIPGFVTRQKFLRNFNYADDPNSDIARLYDNNINPTRVNDQGQVIYGQKTMLKRLTALNRLNVIMLIAGIHKRFAAFLDNRIFQLNTPTLRSNIQSELQAQIDSIRSATPAGITAGNVVCDESNNTLEIIDANQLIVDVVIQPTRAIEFITLRTTVQRTGEDLNAINTSIIGG